MDLTSHPPNWPSPAPVATWFPATSTEDACGGCGGCGEPRTNGHTCTGGGSR